MKPYLLILILLVSVPTLFSQEIAPSITPPSNKGRIYFYWGWNRSWYSQSDLHLKGENYDFRLDDLRATDRPSKVGIDPYFTPSKLSLPQTNARIGYYLTDKIDISIGLDHMKYVLTYNQDTRIDGYINTNSIYDGIFTNDEYVNTYSFLKFEHTDGLNYINLEIHRNDDLLVWKNKNSSRELFRLKSIFGFGGGVLLPKSNVKLWNKERHDDFHLAGYGFAGLVGLDFIVLNHFFYAC